MKRIYTTELAMQTEYCELCGVQITKRARLVQIEGAKPMKVCDKCAKLGTEVQTTRSKAQSGRFAPQSSASRPVHSPSAPRKRDMFDFIEGDVVEDFSKRIAAARQAKGFSQKDLAYILKMQEGDIKKLERGDRAPTEAERKKIEKELGIVLLDVGDDSSKSQAGGVTATTLGDVIQIKRK